MIQHTRMIVGPIRSVGAGGLLPVAVDIAELLIK